MVPTDTSEKGLEALIVESLVTRAGYVLGRSEDYAVVQVHAAESGASCKHKPHASQPRRLVGRHRRQEEIHLCGSSLVRTMPNPVFLLTRRVRRMPLRSVVWRKQFDDPVAAVILADVNGDGKSEILASVGDGYVYVLGP